MAISRSNMHKQISVGNKIKKLKKEGKPQRQAVAIALNMKRKKSKRNK
tara:strand:- start:3149 stop:3292 length:144 start_codon:yes stop_codon:yes gene_type:complete